MKDFRKRALILVLASVVTVTGSFAADNYKNCLMDIRLKSKNAGQVSVILDTQKPYASEIIPRKTDSNTYVIMLPEVDNSAASPDLTESLGNIRSVEMRKMPYSNGGIGYTKIVIRTSDDVNLSASTALYIPKKESLPQISTQAVRTEDYAREQAETRRLNNENRNDSMQRRSEYQNVRNIQSERTNHRTERSNQYRSNSQDNSSQQQDSKQNGVIQEDTQDYSAEGVNTKDEISSKVYDEESSNQQYLLGLLIVLVIMSSIYFYLRAQDKMSNVIGEKLKIDINESDEKESKKSGLTNKHKISRTINKLDAAYKKTNTLPIQFQMRHKMDTSERIEDENIVDLDALFKEKQSEQQSESALKGPNTDALDEFLRGFTFETENSDLRNADADVRAEIGFDEEEYQKLLQKSNIIFSAEDIKCFKELLQTEISDNVLNNINKYAVSNPIDNKKPSENKILEDFVMDYSISRNITFNSKDIEALRKLISVELDENFIKDLRVNPNRTMEMEKEIKASKNYKIKPSEIITLNVKDMLPDLSKALKEQGNRPVKSEAKPETIYYSEGYEVSKLSVDIGDLPNLTEELGNKSAYKSMPSAVGQVVDQSYSDSVQKLSISGLPDLEDVIAHPDKYKEPETIQPKANEKSLLKSIKNVKFKPFDDGTRSFEIINNFDEEAPDNQDQNMQVSDIEKEFSQFDNFEVANTEETENSYSPVEYDDFEELYNKNFINLDSKNIGLGSSTNISKSENEEIAEKKNINAEDIEKADYKHSHKKQSTKYKELINKIKNRTGLQTKIDNKSIQSDKADSKKDKPNANVKEEPVNMKCLLEGVSYNVVGSAEIQDNIGCYLAKSEKGYAVLGYNGSELTILKGFDKVKTNKIQARLSETMSDGTPRYLVKVGVNKFIIDVKDGRIVYVMDLC